jgi:excisionase family DNA binding protein
MDKITYSAPELAILLGISRSAAYNLMHRADFPSFRIGKRLLVKRDKLTEWLDAQGKTTHGYQPPYIFPGSGC